MGLTQHKQHPPVEWNTDKTDGVKAVEREAKATELWNVDDINSSSYIDTQDNRA